MRQTIPVGALVLSLLLVGCSDNGAEAEGDYPSEDMDWTIAFGPGGGNDIMARTIINIIEDNDLYPENISVENLEGGSGASGWGKLFGQSGSGYGVSTTSGSYITTPLQADTGWTHEDFTSIGLFASDDLIFYVPGDGDIETWDDWVEHANDQGPVAVGGIGAVQVDFIVQHTLAEDAGYEMEYVSFNEEGQLQNALSSGAIEAAVSNPAEILGQVEAGEVQPLMFTGPQSLSSLPDLPTGEELGFPDLPSMPRGMILPPDAPQEAQEWWIETMQEVVETDEWQEYIENNYLTENILWGDDFDEFLDSTVNEFEETLDDAGAL